MNHFLIAPFLFGYALPVIINIRAITLHDKPTPERKQPRQSIPIYFTSYLFICYYGTLFYTKKIGYARRIILVAGFIHKTKINAAETPHIDAQWRLFWF